MIPRALVQILVNLLRNACEASVIGRKKRVRVAVAAREGRAEVAIEDRGPAFDPGILARLGEPFQTTKEDRGGMGLGLYVSALLAKQMGAELAVIADQIATAIEMMFLRLPRSAQIAIGTPSVA